MKQITDEIMENVSILAKLELTEAEKEKAKQDMEKMLSYIEIMDELDTSQVTPFTHFPMEGNVFREDEVEEYEDMDGILENAPARKDEGFEVPRTIG